MSRSTKRYTPPVVKNRIYEILINGVAKTNYRGDVVNFLTDLLSPPEREMLAKRLAIAYLLVEDSYTHRQISEFLRVGLGTIQRVASVLEDEGAGYRKMINSLKKEERLGEFMAVIAEKITALPTKGKGSGVWRDVNQKIKSRSQKVF
ncbi:MAG: hypothetical protein HY376_01645 [Candidatus Blackburnbacteria bacterium]|nr:hypothetical protein [Candidatus Blackburnbacteria bacterium]